MNWHVVKQGTSAMYPLSAVEVIANWRRASLNHAMTMTPAPVIAAILSLETAPMNLLKREQPVMMGTHAQRIRAVRKGFVSETKRPSVFLDVHPQTQRDVKAANVKIASVHKNLSAVKSIGMLPA